jgi:ABC-type transport system involved in cytochrome bd biosynthesis fused ATPase/permease subunit
MLAPAGPGVRVGDTDGAPAAPPLPSGDLLDRVQADIDSLDRVVLAVAVSAVVAAIVGASGLAVLALIRPAFAAATALALAVALAGDVVAGRRGRRAGRELARARAAARTRLVEVLDGRLGPDRRDRPAHSRL